MLKLMKYEFRKMRTTLLIMFLILVALEAGFIIGSVIEHEYLHAVCLMLITMLAAVVYAYILISGIVSYSRELKDRTGYLIFMAPVRPIAVVASKICFTVLSAVIAAVLFGGFAVLDYMHLFELLGFTRTEWAELSISFRVMFAEAGITLNQVVLTGVYLVLSVLIEMIALLSTAYLSMTVSATVMSNRKGFWRGFVSFGLFVAIMSGISWLTNTLLMPEKVADADALTGLLGWSLLLSGGISCLFAMISAALLKRRVSL